MNMLEYYYIYFLISANLLITTGIILIDIHLENLSNHENELFNWWGLWLVIDQLRLYTPVIVMGILVIFIWTFILIKGHVYKHT